MTTYPSGVHYMHLVDHARAYIEKTFRRPLLDRTMRAMLAWLMPYPARFRLALIAALAARPFAPILEAIGIKRIAAVLRLASISGFGVGVLVGMTGMGGGSLMTLLLILLVGI